MAKVTQNVILRERARAASNTWMTGRSDDEWLKEPGLTLGTDESRAGSPKLITLFLFKWTTLKMLCAPNPFWKT